MQEPRYFRINDHRQAAFSQKPALCFKALVEAVRDYAIYMIDANGFVVTWNAGAQAIKGYSAAYIIGRHFSIFYPPDAVLRRIPQWELEEAVRYGNFEDQGWRVRQDGSRFWATVIITPIYDPQGTLTGFAKVTRDISDWYEAMRQLRSLNTRLIETLESTSDGFYLLDREWRFAYINHQSEKILGVQRQMLQGMVIWNELPGLVGTRFEREYRHAMQERKPVRFEAPYVATGKWLSVNANPVEDGLAIYFQDITERKAAEAAQQVQAEQLQALNRRLAEVQEEERRALAQELHDRVGQNLTALNINLNIIKAALPGDLDSRLHARLEDSQRLLEETIASTRDVMAELRPAVLEDYGLAGALQWQAARFQERTNITVEVLAPEEFPRLSLATEATLFRMVQEALTNVAKHAQASQIRITLEYSPRFLTLTVDDNGNGMPEKSLVHRSHGGLGLAGIVERLHRAGGQLDLGQSQLGGACLVARIFKGGRP